MMKHRLIKRIMAVLTASTLILPAIPAQTAVAEESPDILVTLVDGEASPSGDRTVTAIDPEGREVVPDLIPAYGDRALSLPSSYDLRDEDIITPVKDQGSTGSCWAHAAIASSESSMIRKGLADASLDLSEAHLVWFGNCSYSTDTNDPLYLDGENEGTAGYKTGGNYRIATATLAAGVGVQLEENEPAVTQKASLPESHRYVSYGRLREALTFAAADRDAIKLTLMETGAMSLSYQDSTDYYNSKTYAHYCPEAVDTDHAVTLIGWDDSFSRTNFKTAPSSDGAWLCKNSWGNDWGDGGYFWISYEDQSLAYITSYEIQAPDRYASVYQYDRAFARYFTNQSTDFYMCGANVFTAEKDENVAAVSFLTAAADTDVTVCVFNNVRTTPNTGRLVSQQTVHCAYAGYHTVDLLEPAQVQKGTKFAVAVVFRTLGAAGAVYIDSHLTGEGDSYLGHYYSKGNYFAWSDIYSGGYEAPGNVCIKAFTRDGLALSSEIFPDDAFRTYLAENFDTDGDHLLSKDEIAAIQTVDVTGTAVASITGIEHLTSMTTLRCRDTALLQADLAPGQSLKALESEGCGRTFATCWDVASLDVDVSKIHDIKGGVIQDGHIVPLGPTVVYTYDTGAVIGKSPAYLTVTLLSETEEVVHADMDYQDADGTHHNVICSDCGYTVEEAHVWVDWIPTIGSDHMHYCTLCYHEETEPHVYGEWVSAGADGHTHTCDICGGTEAKDHVFGDWKDAGDGTHSRACTDCGETETADHRYTYESNTDGTHTAVCMDCGAKETLPHSFSDWKDNKDGTHSRTCADCGEVETVEHRLGEYAAGFTGIHFQMCSDCGAIVTGPHRFGDYVVNKDGTHTHTCLDCGTAVTEAHTFGDYTVNADGTHTHQCTICGFAETSDHDYGAYTALADGTHIRTCMECGDTEVEDHIYGAWVDLENGKHIHFCDLCHSTETKRHSYGGYTPNADGTHSHTCLDCGAVQTEEHTFGSWMDDGIGTRTRTCKDCGFVETDVYRIMGDVDCNGSVEVTDIIRLLRWLHGNKVTLTDPIAADMDQNGRIDIFDLGLLRRALLGKK